MFKKRGQLTLFVIVGIVIVIGIVLYFLFNGSIIPEQQKTFNSKANILQSEIFDCFENVYSNSLMTIGFQGGFYNVSDGAYNGFAIIPYYYKSGELMAPNLNLVENELATLVKDQITYYCLDYYTEVQASSSTLNMNFSGFDLADEDFPRFNIDYNNLDVNVKIDKGSVSFDVDCDLTVIQDEKNIILDLSTGSNKLDSDLYDMFNIASFIVNDLEKNEESICASCLYDMTKNTDLTVDIAGYNVAQDQIVVISNDQTSTPFIYQFLIKHSSDIEEIIK